MSALNRKREIPVRTAFYIRCTQEEYDKLVDDEKTTGIKVSILLKRSYFSGRVSTVLLPPEERKEWFKELHHWGNNLNQLARRVNSGIMGGWQREISEIHRMLKVLENKVASVYGSSTV